jgi:DNA polymerase
MSTPGRPEDEYRNSEDEGTPVSERAITLAGAIDFEGFRRACRGLWAEQVSPERVRWQTAGADSGSPDSLPGMDVAAPSGIASSSTFATTPVAAASPLNVPASYLVLCQSVILHSDPRRFGLMYRLLWRLQVEPGLRRDANDADRLLARQMAHEVRGDIQRMQTSIGVRKLDAGAALPPWHLAWFEPRHHIVEAAAPFVARRFGKMRWAIVTPERSVRHDDGGLCFGPGRRHDEMPSADAGDGPLLDWIDALFASEARRSGALHVAGPGADSPRGLPELREALERCRECPIGEHAAQAVPGVGPRHARLMFVGEQPGDQEDQRGLPFVGPAGQLFDRALAELGIPRDQVRISNAVKHFKFELRGKRRIHKTPAQEEAAACLHWLENEIALVDPGALVALGATAARQLMGRGVAVTRQRGQWLVRSDGRRVLITLHPSALLRMEPADQAAAYTAWLGDLRHAAQYFASNVASQS